MMSTLNYDMTEAEFKVLRVIWTHQPVPSRKIIDYLLEITDWKEGTIKSLLHRLLQKGYIEQDTTSKPYLYKSLVVQEACDHARVSQVLSTVCTRRRGKVLSQLIQANDLSQADCCMLMELLEDKAKNAPLQVPCQCAPGQCHCVNCCDQAHSSK